MRIILLLLFSLMATAMPAGAVDQLPTDPGASVVTPSPSAPTLGGFGPVDYFPATPADEIRDKAVPMAPDSPSLEQLLKRQPPPLKDDNTARL
ncbi:MAG: hypothetical protein HY543_08270 [Deltaproteobacteria bacterium]|nr:hypothetical protein [Deltaproteobacteria bacterium]